MNMFRLLIEKLKKSPKTIVFTEGEDPRILEASSRLLASSFLTPILIGTPEKIYESAEESGFNIRGANIIDPNNFDDFDKMVDEFLELRREKGATEEEARRLLRQNNYFGTMLVKQHDVVAWLKRGEQRFALGDLLLSIAHVAGALHVAHILDVERHIVLQPFHIFLYTLPDKPYLGFANDGECNLHFG